MCNLYRMTKTTAEVAQMFDAIDAAAGTNFGAEVYPGYPGLVVAGGQVQRMNWGFPLVMKGKQGQPLKPKPVNNARTDKLDSFFWRSSFEDRRCLIPLSGWAEAQGAKGNMTRTWLCLPDSELFACAGVWRASDVHSRMPVLLRAEDYQAWLSGPPDEAKALCKAWTGDLRIDHSDEAWVKGKPVQTRLL